MTPSRTAADGPRPPARSRPSRALPDRTLLVGALLGGLLVALPGCTPKPSWDAQAIVGTLLHHLDSDRDGGLDEAEWEAVDFQGPPFSTLDVDGDGALSAEELLVTLQDQDPLTFDGAPEREPPVMGPTSKLPDVAGVPPGAGPGGAPVDPVALLGPLGPDASRPGPWAIGDDGGPRKKGGGRGPGPAPDGPPDASMERGPPEGAVERGQPGADGGRPEGPPTGPEGPRGEGPGGGERGPGGGGPGGPPGERRAGPPGEGEERRGPGAERGPGGESPGTERKPEATGAISLEDPSLLTAAPVSGPPPPVQMTPSQRHLWELFWVLSEEAAVRGVTGPSRNEIRAAAMTGTLDSPESVEMLRRLREAWAQAGLETAVPAGP